ncbi:hypothetical protein [Marivita sp.]|uniref:hypothetical protein n=1 Tax=Marivita sp. TaxID=2003365 RepID=UPI0025BA18C5|nr:hypothetical protein [Marivita sp.]
MSGRTRILAAVSALLLAGCLESEGFGGSGGSSGGGGFGGTGGSGGFGGSNQAGLSLARDVCFNDIESRGARIVRVESERELLNRAEIVVLTRRSAVSLNTERRLCTFYYNTGLHDTRRI